MCIRDSFGIDPKVAVLSFSTKGSGKGGTVQLSHDATVEAQKLAPELAIDGELQFDAAVSPVVAATKCKGSPAVSYTHLNPAPRGPAESKLVSFSLPQWL